ncbi:hypothetical protein CYY_001692 [Polysphondylium violaceum]|uniref:RNA polymerase II complex component n=1 Tax=Polysphondylium violaceum TaxID=133409 RepID=A0A8J4PXV7_9MYCE|nr:hypothetical protein CYY_001692 [Polysphondylium violaceum]
MTTAISNKNVSCLYIPIKDYDQGVRVPIDPLPNVDDILEILKGEVAPLDLWLKLAIEYYKQDKIQDFIKLLSQVLDPAIEEFYKDSKVERIAMLNALASYYTQLGTQERDKLKKEEYFNQATFHFNKADKIDLHQPLTWIGKAVLLLCKGEVDRAETNFQKVLDLASKDSTIPGIPAKLGHACILFNKGNYDKALDTYQKVIHQNANCSPSVRLGLGYSYFKLGRNERAKESFERVLQLDQDNVEALIGLSLVLMNEDQLAQAMELILQAYKLSPTNPIVLNHLANHYFFRGELSKVHPLAFAAFNNTDVSHIKAESCYLIARAYHAMEKWKEALQYYHQAVLKCKDFYLAQYGLGQTYLHNGDFDKAIACFELVLEKQPNNYETLQVLGVLYKHSSHSSKDTEKIKRVVKKATELNPTEPSNWIELGQILETTSELTAALDAYERGVGLMKASDQKVSSEILNNIAVLRQQKGLYPEAEATYLQIISESGFELNDYKAVNVTTTYNLARLYESMGQVVKAKEIYKGILKEHPNYIDCYLRLGCICKNEGENYESSEWYREALNISPNNAEAWALYGNLHLSRDEWYHAQKKFEQVLESSNKNDTYASLSLGNIYYNAKFSTPDKVEKYLGNAESYFQRILSKNPNNIYAANGIGMVAAEKGNFALSSEIFLQLREAAIDVQPVSINLAHIYMARGLYDNAIKLYESCLKKSTSLKDTELLLLYLSKAYYEANRFVECKLTLKKALHHSPSNQSLLYNYAITIESHANMISTKPNKKTWDTSNSITELDFAKKVLTNLSNTKPNPKLNFSISKAKHHLAKVEKLHTLLVDIHKNLEQQESDLAKKKGIAFEIQKKEEEEKKKILAEAEALRLQRVEADLKAAQEIQDKINNMATEDDSATTPSKKRKKGNNAEEDANNDDDEGLFGSDDDKKRSKKRKGTDDDGENEQEEEEAAVEGGETGETGEQETNQEGQESNNNEVEMEEKEDLFGSDQE